MTQTRAHSLLEAISNIIVGYTLNIFVNAIVFRLMQIDVSLNQNLAIGCVFTGVSLCRSYFIRRLFNKHTGGGK